MVNLTLTPHRGNGARTFPSTGYLGMTPVSLAGVVRVKIEEDQKTIQASSLVVRVRCYENIGGNHHAAGNANATSESNTFSGAGTPSSSSSGYHSSSCLGSSSTTGYSFTDILKGTSASTTGSSSSSSSNGASTKGRVLYEKSITMWTPPSTPSSSSTSTSTPLTSRSSSSSQFDNSSSSSQTPQEDGEESDSPPHAYPPRRRQSSPSSNSSEVNYGTLGEFTKAWRIVIPPEAVAEHGAKSTMVFKNWKIWWAVEAVISHRPQGIHGDRIIKSHQVALLSYAPRSLTSKAPEWQSTPTNPHPLAYSITSSKATFGSNDPFEFHIQLHKKSSNAETPKKVTLELRREITFSTNYAHTTSEPSPTTPSYGHPSSFEAAQNQAIREANIQKKSTHFTTPRGMHSRTNSSTLSNLLPTSNNPSRYKSESQEALIPNITTPPPLSNTSSNFSCLMPATPPAYNPQDRVSTPAEYAESSTLESYFGLFNGSASRKNSLADLSNHSIKTSKNATRSSPPNATLSLPSSHISTSSSKRNTSNSNNNKKEDITLATFEVDCLFTSSTWNGKITGNMPKVRSSYHYALGETCQTPTQSYNATTGPGSTAPSSNIVGGASASSRFYLIPRIHYKSKHSFIELPPVDILFYTVSEEDRKKATEMIPKIMAIQKAEARLFGGDEVLSSAKPAGHQQDTKARKLPSHPASVYTKSRQGQQSSASSTLVRPRTSQSVSPKVGTGKTNHPLPALKLPDTDSVMQDDATPRSSTVRRRSEQAEELLDCPRTRQRFASIPDLSPIVGSPYIDAVSPSLSVISSSTSRPRTAVRSRPTTANSTKSSSSRPRSSAALEINTSSSSAWSTYLSTSGNASSREVDTSGADMFQYASQSSTGTVGSTMPVPPALDSASSSSTRTSSASDSSMETSPRSISSKENYRTSTGSGLKNYNYGPGPVTPAAVNGLFAEFSGFSLKPPDHMLTQIPIIREELVAPKSTKPSISSSASPSLDFIHVASPSAANSNKRKSTELLAGPGHTKMVPSKSANGSIHSTASSTLIAFHEITLASPPSSVSMNPNNVPHNTKFSPKARSSTMSKVPSHNSGLDVPSPLVDTGINANNSRRAKSGMSGAFSFFRRSSARI